MQGTQLLSLVQEDSTWLRATKLVHRNFRVCASTSEVSVSRACPPKQREPPQGEGSATKIHHN